MRNKKKYDQDKIVINFKLIFKLFYLLIYFIHKKYLKIIVK